MNWFQQWKLRREIRRDLIALRRENRHLSDAEFADLAEQFVRDEYEGVDPDNLKLILDFLRELLPIILELFPLLIVLMLSLVLVPQASGSDFLTTVSKGPGCSFPVAAKAALEPVKDPVYLPPFRNQWTWPGGTTESLRRHLAEENHRLDPAVLASMSHAELVALHNSDHDGLLDRSRYQTTSVAIRNKRNAPIVTSSSCPGGVCPTSSPRIFQRRLFRRW